MACSAELAILSAKRDVSWVEDVIDMWVPWWRVGNVEKALDKSGPV
jgi:hypothetical protein